MSLNDVVLQFDCKGLMLLFPANSNATFPMNLSSFFHYLIKGENREALKWNQRVSIAIDVARGLEYLHDGVREKKKKKQ